MNDSPSIETFVLLLLAALANKSAKCAESLACNPNAVSASVTMSDVVPNSSPLAAAKFNIPGKPSIISCAFQPAIPINSIASADSLALNLVFAPHSLAVFSNCFISSDVAPEIACTLLICASNSPAVFTAAPRKVPAAIEGLANALPVEVNAFPKLFTRSSAPPVPVANFFKSAPALRKPFLNPLLSSVR